MVPVVGRLETPKSGHGKLMRGNPGQRKGGRPSKRFKNWCARMLERPDMKRAVRKMMRRAARTGRTEELRPMIETLAKYGHHELTQTRDLKVSSGKELLATLDEALQDD